MTRGLGGGKRKVIAIEETRFRLQRIDGGGERC